MIYFDDGRPRYAEKPQQRRQPSLTTFEKIHQQLSFLDVAGRADLLPRLAPLKETCVFCNHPTHDERNCQGRVTAMVDIDEWQQVQCSCPHHRSGEKTS